MGRLLAVDFARTATEPVASGFDRRFNDVATIWFERNILLQNTIWPRKAHLELVSFDGKPIVAGEELKIGRDAAAAEPARAGDQVGCRRQGRRPGLACVCAWADLTPDLPAADVPVPICGTGLRAITRRA